MALVKKMMVPFTAYSFNTLNRNLTKHLKQVYIAADMSDSVKQKRLIKMAQFSFFDTVNSCYPSIAATSYQVTIASGHLNW